MLFAVKELGELIVTKLSQKLIKSKHTGAIALRRVLMGGSAAVAMGGLCADVGERRDLWRLVRILLGAYILCLRIFRQCVWSRGRLFRRRQRGRPGRLSGATGHWDRYRRSPPACR